jgi:hypothetical protein
MARQPAASSAVSDTRWIASSVFSLQIFHAVGASRAVERTLVPVHTRM